MDLVAGGSLRNHAVAPTRLADCPRALEGVVERLFDPLRMLSSRLERAWNERLVSREFSTADLVECQRDIFDVLDRVPEYDSAGYVLKVGLLADAHRYLEWWRRSERSSYQPLILNLDPDSPDHYDYDAMEWFGAARDRASRFVSGPLIDLPCAEAHIMTFSQPVRVDDRFLGISGADVAMSRLESSIVPPLSSVGVPAVLVNGSRRVIASGGARWASGDKLRTMPTVDSGDWQAVLPVTTDLGWMLAVQQSARRRPSVAPCSSAAISR